MTGAFKIFMEKTRWWCLAVPLVCAMAGNLRAQTEEGLLQELTALQQQRSSTNFSLLGQLGASNEAYVVQVSTNHANIVGGLQAGQSNYIQLHQSGNFNAILIFQFGSGNVYRADVDGDEMDLNIRQYGHDNRISQSLLLRNSGFTLIQEGDRNEIEHSGRFSNTTGIQVLQEGFGMKLIIQSQ